MRGSWRPKKDCNILASPASLDIAVCRSRSPRLLNRRPGAQPLWDMFSFQHLLTTGLVSKFAVGPEGPFCWAVAFPTTSFFLHLVWTPTDFLSPPSYIIVQSPTQSLEWHVWSSSSGNNCHAVHRSLSSVVSVYECTMGFLPCPIFSAKPAYAISSYNCHRNVSLPSGASLWNGMFGRVEGQYTTHTLSLSLSYIYIEREREREVGTEKVWQV